MHDWIQHFPAIDTISDIKLRDDISRLRPLSIPQGKHLFHEDDVCRGYVLLLHGSVRVYKIDSEGREILLYRVHPGETCMLTSVCLIGHQTYPAEGLAETDVKLVQLSPALFDRMMMQSEAFRQMAIAHVGLRILDMMALIEDVAFVRMDVRVAKLLLAKTDVSHPTFTTTHQMLASELGTAREVVSRMLKSFESQGILSLSRGKLQILNREALQNIIALMA